MMMLRIVASRVWVSPPLQPSPQAREQGVELRGDSGLLKQTTKAVLERALAAELTDHLGHEEGDPAGTGSGK